jgi:hypothetical protein
VRLTERDAMKTIPRLRERTEQTLALIENDMLSKLGHIPDRIDRDPIRESAKLAFYIRQDAACGRCGPPTWEAESLLHEGFCALGLSGVVTVASKSLERAAAGRG